MAEQNKVAEAEPLAEEVNATADANRTPVAINWLMAPTNMPEMSGNKLKDLFEFIKGTFVQKREEMGFQVKLEGDPNKNPAERLKAFPEGLVLMSFPEGFELKVCPSLAENTIHPGSLEGAGEITPEHGHKPFLMLLHLEQRFKEEWPDHRERTLIMFCDEEGNVFKFTNFSSLEPIIERMGFDPEIVRNDAVKLGLVAAPIDWSKISTDIEDDYF